MPESYKKLRDPPPVVIFDRKDPFIKKCCCLPLRTGCLIIGWFTTITAVLFLVSQIAFLSLSKSYIEKALREKLKLDQSNEQLKQSLVDSAIDIGLAVGYVTIILTFIGMIAANVVMLFGTYKKRPSYLKAYVVIYVICIIMVVIHLIRSMGKGTATPLECFISVFDIFISGFAAFIVHCHRQELTRELDSLDVLGILPTY